MIMWFRNFLKQKSSVITGRRAKGWTQKDLATKICEKPQVVTEYEQGKAIPNQNVIGKIERAIGKQRKAQLIKNSNHGFCFRIKTTWQR